MNGMLETIIKGASRIMLEQENAKARQKDGHSNFVTEADIAVQEYLREKLLAYLPDSLFFAEEQENTPLTDTPTWMVDPIDGTTNFMRGRRFSAISVALMENKQPVLGLIYNPYTGEMFRAEKGKGATLNGTPIAPAHTPFEHAIVTIGTSPYNPKYAEVSMRAALQFLFQAGDLRRTGSAALELAEVACGRTDVFYEMSLAPWDYAAGCLLVQEAGGKLIMPFAEKMDYGKTNAILACNPLCLQKAESILRAAVEQA